jgi:RecG-like helicase
MRITKDYFFERLKTYIDTTKAPTRQIETLAMLLIYEAGLDMGDICVLTGTTIKRETKELIIHKRNEKRTTYITPNIEYALSKIDNKIINKFLKADADEKRAIITKTIKNVFGNWTDDKELQKSAYLNLYDRGATLDNIIEIYPFSKNIEYNKYRDQIAEKLGLEHTTVKELMTKGGITGELIEIMDTAVKKDNGENLETAEKVKYMQETGQYTQKALAEKLREKYNTPITPAELSAILRKKAKKKGKMIEVIDVIDREFDEMMKNA